VFLKTWQNDFFLLWKRSCSIALQKCHRGAQNIFCDPVEKNKLSECCASSHPFQWTLQVKADHWDVVALFTFKLKFILPTTTNFISPLPGYREERCEAIHQKSPSPFFFTLPLPSVFFKACFAYPYPILLWSVSFKVVQQLINDHVSQMIICLIFETSSSAAS